MAVSLKHISEELGLSKTTVSWVLSGRGDEKNISKDTQKRVLACAKKMNYVPNTLARSLSVGYTKTIGLIVPSISDSFYSNISHVIGNAANRSGYSIMIASSDSDGKKEADLIRMYREKMVDGMIIASTKLTENVIRNLVKEGYPLVLIDRYFAGMDVDSVVIDNEQASCKVVGKLLDRGYRKVAMVTTNAHLTTMDMRRAGYEQAFRIRGLEPESGLQCSVGFDNYEAEVAEALGNLISREPDVDSFFFTTHILLVAAIRYFDSVGFDYRSGKIGFASMRTEPLLDVLLPDLCVAHFPEEEMGGMAVDILLDSIRELSEADRHVPKLYMVECDVR